MQEKEGFFFYHKLLSVGAWYMKMQKSLCKAVLNEEMPPIKFKEYSPNISKALFDDYVWTVAFFLKTKLITFFASTHSLHM